MRGAYVKYTLKDGSIVTKGGSFDLLHIFIVKARVKRKHKVIGHNARWKYVKS